MTTTGPEVRESAVDRAETVRVLNGPAGAPLRRSIGGAFLLLGSLAVLGSCMLPWLSGETVDKPGLPVRVFVVHVWSTLAVVVVPFFLLSVALLLSAGLRSLRGLPADLGRESGLLVALGGIVGTAIFFLLLMFTVALHTFNGWGAMAGWQTDLKPALGGAVCLTGYALTLLGAAFLPATTRAGNASAT